MIGGNVCVNDAVSQSFRRFLFQHSSIVIHHPIDRTIAHGVCAHMNPGVVQESNDLPVHIRIERGNASSNPPTFSRTSRR